MNNNITHTFTILVFISLLMAGSACAQPQSEPQAPVRVAVADTTLRWRSFPDAVAEAEAHDKKLLVFIYTDWCGWCRRFQKEVYSDPAVRTYLNEAYAITRVNAESNEKLTFKDMSFTESELALSLQARGFPTHVFMAPGREKLQYLYAMPGFMPADKFGKALRYFGQNHFEKVSFEEYLDATK